MDDTCREAFELRYYRWASEQFRREIDDGYPCLRTFPTGTVPRLLSWMEHLPAAERHRIAQALVKRWKSKALEQSGEALTDEEQGLLRKFSEKCRKPVLSEGLRADKFRTGELRRPAWKQVIAVLRRELSPVLGDPAHSSRAGSWLHASKVGEGTVETWVDVHVEGLSQGISYQHLIRLNDQSLLCERVSLLSYLGIASSTRWTGLSADDAAGVCRSLVCLCQTFWEALPTLLDGIELTAFSGAAEL